MTRRMLSALVVLGLTLAVLGPLASLAAGRWSRPQRLSPVSTTGDVATYPHVGVDARGNAVAIWAELYGSGLNTIMVARRDAGTGRWTRPVGVSRAGVDSDFPELAVAPTGAAVAVWEASGRPAAIDAAFRRSTTGSWSRPVQISSSNEWAYQPQIGIDSHGRATAAWVTFGTSNRVEAAAFDLRSGRWSPPTVLAGSSRQFLTPRVAVNGGGEVVVVWKLAVAGGVLSPTGTVSEIDATVKPARSKVWPAPAALGQEFEPQLQADVTFEFPGPQVALDGAGNALLVWQGQLVVHHAAETGTDVAMWDRRRERWRRRPQMGEVAEWPHLAASAGGTIALAWQASWNTVAVAERRIAGCCWSRTARFRTMPGVTYPHVAVDLSGDAIVGWSRTGGQVQIALHRSGAARWGPPAALGSANAGVVELAVDTHRNVFAVWVQPGKPHGSWANNFIDFAATTIG